MNRDMHISIRYSMLQGLYWLSYCPIYIFATVFLLGRSFSEGEIGILLALSCLLSAVFQPFAAAAADRGRYVTLRSLMTGVCICTVVPMLILLFIPQGKLISGICYVVLLMLHLAYQPLLSALGMQLLNSGYALNFGAARGIGSLCCAVLSFFLGSLTLRFSNQCLPLLGTILYLVTILLLQTIPETKRNSGGIVPSNGTMAVLRAHRKFTILCCGIILVFISHSAINTYMIQILQHIGKGNSELGQVIAYTAVLEFIVMIGFSRFVKGRNCGAVLKFTSVFFVLKALFVPLAGNLFLLYAALLTQVLSFALFTPASVYYANQILEAGDKIKGQAILTIAITIGNIAGSFLCGSFIELWGITIAILITAGLAAIGMLFFWFGAEKSSSIQ